MVKKKKKGGGGGGQHLIKKKKKGSNIGSCPQVPVENVRDKISDGTLINFIFNISYNTLSVDCTAHIGRLV